MITQRQTILIHTALRDIRGINPAFDDAAYRTTLRSICNVSSSKELTQAGFEQIMSFFESVGWTDPHHGAGYWTGKSEQPRRGQTSDRQIRMIDTLVEEIHVRQPGFSLAGFCRRMTNHRTSDRTGLWPKEAHNLIEALKAIASRAGDPTGRDPESPMHSGSPKPYSPTPAELAQFEKDALPI